MYSLSKLLAQLPTFTQSRMVASGIGVWMVYSGHVSKPLVQTLMDHGGVQLATDGNQSLWFFFSKEAYRALARLQIWLRLNPLQIFFEAMPATFLVGYDMGYSVSIAPDLKDQYLSAPGDPVIWVHPKLEDAVLSVPGLGVRPGNVHAGMSTLEWKLLHTDPSFNYESELDWYFIIKPLGKKLDKEYSTGWRYFYSRVEPVIQRLGLKYIWNDSFLILPIDSMRLLRNWCREIIYLIRDIKTGGEGHYWPMVMAAVPKKGLNFNEELPKKVALEWNRLAPDYPHLSFRDAFTLGREFDVNEIGYSMSKGRLEDWCHITLGSESKEQSNEQSIQIKLPRKLLTGETECFYCGLKSHTAPECPSHGFMSLNPEIWDELATIPMNQYGAVAQELDEALTGNTGTSLSRVLEGSGKSRVLATAIFEMTAPFQLRYLRLVWRSRSKDWLNAFEQLAPEEGEYIWVAMQCMQSHKREEAEVQLKQATLRFPRSYQPRSLNGFASMEAQDSNQALYYFQEAARLSYTPVQKILFLMLAGRMHEILGEFEKATALYKEAELLSRGWGEARYRQGVCMVKMGFTDHAMNVFQECIDKNPHYFNRILIDPELERGRFQIQATMSELWKEARELDKEAKKQLEALSNKMTAWFSKDHEFSQEMQKSFDRLRKYGEIENYVFVRKLAAGCNALEEEIDKRIEAEVSRLSKKVEIYFSRLKTIMREASWFPFPKMLRDFSRDFNYCAEKMHWMYTQYLKNAENFRRGQAYSLEVEERLDRLQKRLVSLRLLRDGTFFGLLLGRNFLWMQLVGLGLALLLMPLIVYLAEHSTGYLSNLILTQKWNLQKGLVIVLSIVAMCLAALRTAVTFEKRKRKFFDQEYERVREERQARERKKREAAKNRRKLQVEAMKQAQAAPKPEIKPWKTAGTSQARGAGARPQDKPTTPSRR